jgi:hypothetical protein
MNQSQTEGGFIVCRAPRAGRPELEPLPERMAHLPIDARGYVVPFFVQWVRPGSDPLEPMPVGAPGAVPEFRAFDPAKWVTAVRDKRCWVCGDPLGKYRTFVIGPMCAINRTTAEPPCHRECAVWSARNCPFLSRPQMVRREDDRINVETCKAQVAGEMIARNPGVTLLWTTRRFQVYDDGRGKPLIEIGDPESVVWLRLGRPATRAEVVEAIDTGLPRLEAACAQERTAHEQAAARVELGRRRAAVEALLPT